MRLGDRRIIAIEELRIPAGDTRPPGAGGRGRPSDAD
jgi:hypothetical protein